LPSLARFEWDPAKRDSNLRKHGVDFVRAAAIFDGWVLEWSDVRRDNSERRTVAVGSTAGQMLTVIYTWRAGKRRIISARRSSGQEARAYRAVQTGDEGPHRLDPG
jgi:uncharacterized DUF497 family protein